MGALSKFLGKPKEVEIDGNKITLYPLKVKDMEIFEGGANPTPEQAKKIATKMMITSIPDSTEEEIENLPMETYTKIMDEINKLNGFKDERIGAIKEKLIKADANK